jgi:glycosyltransferase involved in cell wall biosynthesis
MCKVSIIVPMYNIDTYIEQCILSCLNQTLKDIEIILVNDGSPDSCFQIAKNYAQKDSRIVLLNQPNSGVSVARNYGLEKSHGEWILFLDGDDWLDKKAVETMYYFAVDKKCDILITSFYDEFKGKRIQDRFFNENYIEFNKNNKLDLMKSSIVCSKISNKKAKANVGVPWAKLYNKKYLIENKCTFQPGLKRMQDMIFNLWAFYPSNLVLYVDIPLYHYRLQHESATNKYTFDFDITAKKILNEIQIFICKNKLWNELHLVYSAKAVSLFIEIIRLQYVPKGAKKQLICKLNELTSTYKMLPFKNNFCFHIMPLLNKKEKIINIFLTMHLLPVAYFLCYLASKKKEFILYTRKGKNNAKKI